MRDDGYTNFVQPGPALGSSVIPTTAQPKAVIADLLDEGTLSALLGVSRSTLQMWRYASRGPRYLKIGRLVRYRRLDVEAFLNASECATALDANQ